MACRSPQPNSPPRNNQEVQQENPASKLNLLARPFVLGWRDRIKVSFHTFIFLLVVGDQMCVGHRCVWHEYTQFFLSFSVYWESSFCFKIATDTGVKEVNFSILTRTQKLNLLTRGSSIRFNYKTSAIQICPTRTKSDPNPKLSVLKVIERLKLTIKFEQQIWPTSTQKAQLANSNDRIPNKLNLK